MRVWCKHSVETHFPKDQNCEICQRTKITRAPCRRRNGEAVSRAENLGDSITADHEVLSEGCESRNNLRHAIVVQDLTTQWIQSYPCKTKTSQEAQRSLQKFLEPAKLVKIFPGIIVRRQHRGRKQMGYEGLKKGLLLYCSDQVYRVFRLSRTLPKE